MLISLDLWGTVISGNPEFSEKRYELIGNFFDDELPISYNEVVLKKNWYEVKKEADFLVENFGVQPDLHTLWAKLFSNLGIKLNNFNKIKEFNSLYQSLFLKYPPFFLNGCDYLKNNSNLCISSNTLFTQGKTLNKFLQSRGVNLPSKYSDCLNYSKPHSKMFWNTAYHIGDNSLTDGACEKYGIKFCNVNLKNAKQWVEELKN